MKAIKFLILPIVLALLLPQFIFAAKDGFQTEKIYRGRREGIDPTLLNIKYVQGSDYRKLSWFAHARQEDHEMRLLEADGVLDQTKRKDYIYDYFEDDVLVDWTAERIAETYEKYRLQFYEDSLEEIDYYTDGEQWKKYILLDEQNLEALELWYGSIALSKNPTIRMEFLADAEDKFIYYARYRLTDLSPQAIEWRNGVKEKKTEMVGDTSVAVSGVNAKKPYKIDYYYQIDLESMGMNDDPTNYGWNVLKYYPKDGSSGYTIENNRLSADFNYQDWTGDLSMLQFEMYFDMLDEDYFLQMGIRELGDLLQELD